MLFILNNKEQVVGTLSEMNGSNLATPFFDDEYMMDLASGAETFTFSTLATTPQAQNLVVGNYVAFEFQHDCKMFEIINVTDVHNDQFMKTVYCEMAGIGLLNEYVRPVSMPSANIEQFLNVILQDTEWEVGEISFPTDTVLSVDITDMTTVYQLIQDWVINKYDVEISYSVDIRGGKIVGKYINVYEQRGDFRGYRFAYGSNMAEVQKKVDSSELATALYGVGKDGLDFKTAQADDKPLDQDWVGDDDSYKRWNRNGYHIFGVYSNSECSSAAELLTLTRQALQLRNQPKISYDMKTILLSDSEVSIGDTVYVIDNEFTPPLYLDARVSQLKVSFTDDSKNECTLANFKEVQSNITDEITSIKSQLSANTKNVALAQASADYVASAINDLFNDARLTPNEKQTLQNKLNEITLERDNFTTQSSTAIQNELNDYVLAVNNVLNYVSSNNLLADMTITTVIDSPTINGLFDTYFTRRANLLKRMSEDHSIQVVINSSNGNVFKNGAGIGTVLTALLYKNGDLYAPDTVTYNWEKFKSDGTVDPSFKDPATQTLTVSPTDVTGKATFFCNVTTS